jgi:ribonucleoside-diphosphate reductase beta chain
LTADYFTLFDGYLVDAHQALLSDPSDIEAKVDFVTIYHMVIEGMLALTGRYFQTANLERRGILPGHLKAFNLISRDEHRHVAYGTWFLQQKARDPQLARRIQEKMAETLPAAAGVLVPPGFQLGDDYEYLGYSSQRMNEFAFTALSRRLKVIGVGLPAVAA